jgi:hypothetical protein
MIVDYRLISVGLAASIIFLEPFGDHRGVKNQEHPRWLWFSCIVYASFRARLGLAR